VSIYEMSEQQIGILNSFLLNSPPGELGTVYSDVQGLLGDNKSIYPPSIAEEAFHNYNTEQFVSVQNGDHNFLLTKYNSIGNRQYLDTKASQVVTYDHIKETITDTRPITDELDADVEEWRAAFQTELEKYGNNYFIGSTVGAFSSKEGPAYVVNLCLSSVIYKSSTYYNGRWISSWTVKFMPGKSSELSGTTKCQIHYFESGNVQLNTNSPKTKKGIPAPDPQSLASNIIGTITSLETDFQNQLELLFENMGQTTFKACRRALPIDGRKIRWPLILSYKLGADLTNQ